MQKGRKPKQVNSLLRHEREKRGWSQARLAEVLGAETSMISRWECGERKPEPIYREKLCNLFGKSAAELGFLELPEPPPPMQGISLATLQSDIYLQNNSVPIIVLNSESIRTLPQITVASSQIQVDEAERNDMERRHFLKSLAAGATFLTATSSRANDELLDRFLRALKKPSTIDISALTYLEKRTESYWLDRHGAVLASSDLFSYVIEHFNRIVSLLEATQSPAARTRLCTTASWTALLLGELFIDMGHYSQAREYQQAANTAAHEAGNVALQAVAWGRASLGWIYSKNMNEAIVCIQKARSLAKAHTNTTVRAWLAAIEAEIQANLLNSRACLRALDEAAQFEDQESASEDSYMVFFDRALLNGYQGVCFRRLYNPQDAGSAVFLGKAQDVLMSALTSLDPTLKQRQPTFLADLADTYVRQGEIEEASRRASQALTTASEIKLQKVVQRIHSLRQELEPWENTPYVKELDRHLLPLLK